MKLTVTTICINNNERLSDCDWSSRGWGILSWLDADQSQEPELDWWLSVPSLASCLVLALLHSPAELKKRTETKLKRWRRRGNTLTKKKLEYTTKAITQHSTKWKMSAAEKRTVEKSAEGNVLCRMKNTQKQSLMWDWWQKLHYGLFFPRLVRSVIKSAHFSAIISRFSQRQTCGRSSGRQHWSFPNKIT